MNMRRGFQRITFVLAVVSALWFAMGGVTRVVCKYDDTKDLVRSKKDKFISDYGDIFDSLAFERTGKTEGKVLDIGRFRRKFPMYNDIPDTELIQKLNRKYSQVEAEVRELERGFWANLSKLELRGLCLAAGLAGAAVGFLFAYVSLWFGGSGIYMLIKWLILGFCDDVSSKQVESMEAG